MMFSEYYLQYRVVYCEIDIFFLSFMPTDSLSLQTLCQIFAGQLALIGEPIFCSIDFNICIKFISLTYHISLLTFVLVSFRSITIRLYIDIPIWQLNLTIRFTNEL
jgi:hypothetical protein